MRFLFKNIKLMCNCKVLFVIIMSICINMFYGGHRFGQIMLGVKGGFELYTAIPWIAAILPLFVLTGTYYAASEEISIFVFSRIKKAERYYFIHFATVFSITVLYGLLCFLLALACGENFLRLLPTTVLLIINLFLMANIQYAVYAFKRNILMSIGIVLAIIAFSLLFPDFKPNIGSWAMLVRSNRINPNGFSIPLVLLLQAVLTVFSGKAAIYIKKRTR